MMHLKGRKRDASKGISPLVAAVLLIAVTMTVAGLLAYWASSFVTTSLPETNETATECRFADFSIYSCTHTNSTDTLNVILENLKNIELRNLRTFLFYKDGSVSDPINLNESLPAGGMLKSYTMIPIYENFTKISIRTHCPELIREKVCIKT